MKNTGVYVKQRDDEAYSVSLLCCVIDTSDVGMSFFPVCREFTAKNEP